MTRRLRLPVAVLAATAVLAGCNDNPRISDTDKARITAETLLRLCAERNGPGVVDVLAEDSRRAFIEAGGVLEGCRDVVGIGDPQDIPAPELFRRANVTRVDRDGDQARAFVEAGTDRASLNLLDTGLQWFVSNPPLYEPVGVDDVP